MANIIRAVNNYVDGITNTFHILYSKINTNIVITFDDYQVMGVTVFNEWKSSHYIYDSCFVF